MSKVAVKLGTLISLECPIHILLVSVYKTCGDTPLCMRKREPSCHEIRCVHEISLKKFHCAGELRIYLLLKEKIGVKKCKNKNKKKNKWFIKRYSLILFWQNQKKRLLSIICSKPVNILWRSEWGHPIVSCQLNVRLFISNQLKFGFVS